eukprot:s2289_g6.t1
MRDKWTRIVASFPEIVQMDAVCNRQHKHLGWGFTVNQDGAKVWATSEESQYPRKLCVALVQIILRIASARGVILKPESLHDISNHPLLTAKQSQLSTGIQPRGAKLPPLVPDFQQTAVFFASGPEDIPCALLGKLPHDISLRTESHQVVQVPKHARFLRGCFSPESEGGDRDQAQNKRKFSETTGVASGGCEEDRNYKCVFGLPWECESFIQRACQAGHPLMANHAIPKDLKVAVDKHVEWDECTLAEYRMCWCRRWLKRAKELEKAEREAADSRPAHVKAMPSNKRVLLTEEILKSLNYEDMEVLDLLKSGSTLAGDIPYSPAFQEMYKPCLGTVAQLVREAGKRNQAILASCKSSGDAVVDQQLLDETREEVARGWARGPIEVMPEDAVISRRFPLVQGPKTRMIDDYTISGINDTASCNNKVDLHMVDTFASVIREFFFMCNAAGVKSDILAKTYDLKSAYRQVPVREDHLRFSYFCIYNCEKGQPELYQLLTLPFGATHSVYSFLRLSRMLYTIATRGLYLLTTNFYDDFILDHAYGKTSRLSADLTLGLNMMRHRLCLGRPRDVTACLLETWYVYTDAAYEPDSRTGGLGAALFNVAGQCVAWFGFPLDEDTCNEFGASDKHTIIYELELCAAILALDFWASRVKTGLQVCFGDNDGARFSLIRGSCVNACAANLMRFHLQREADNNLCTWFARVPTEANISDYPSRGGKVSMQSLSAVVRFLSIVILEPGENSFTIGWSAGVSNDCSFQAWQVQVRSRNLNGTLVGSWREPACEVPTSRDYPNCTAGIPTGADWDITCVGERIGAHNFLLLCSSSQISNACVSL